MTTMQLPGSLAEVENSPRGPHIGAFFDLDGTLVAGYTARELSKDQIKSGQTSRADMIRSLGSIIAFARGRLEFADMLRLSIASMEGLKADEVQELGRTTFTKRIENLIYPEMRRLVRAHQERGHTVVLSTSALCLQADPVAEFIGIDTVLSNRFEVAPDGTLTGKVEEPVIWGSGKSDAVQNFCRDNGVDLSQSYFYADGDEDAALMYLIGKPRPTNPGPRLAAIAKRRAWPIPGWYCMATRTRSARQTPPRRTSVRSREDAWSDCPRSAMASRYRATGCPSSKRRWRP